MIESILLDLSRLSDIANLPTKEQAIAQLLGVLNAPVSKLASLMNQVPSKLVRSLDAVREQKLQAES